MARTLPIRLRTIAAAIVVIASGLIIWNAYQSIIGSSDVNTSTLPIIKADNKPFRVLPENPGGAKIPNQGSTLYNVLNAENADVMALDGVNIPANEEQEPETLMDDTQPAVGFELPSMPEKRTESLYGVLSELEQDEQADEVSDSIDIDSTLEKDIEPMKEEATIALKEKLQAAIKKVEEKTELVASPEFIEEEPDVVVKNVAVKVNDDAVNTLTIKPTKKPTYTKPIISEEKLIKEQVVKPDLNPRPIARAPTKKRHYIQLASLRDEVDARNAYKKIRADFPNLVKGLSVSFPQIDLGARGTFTRIQIGPLKNAAEARSRCADYNSTVGATCLVISR